MLSSVVWHDHQSYVQHYMANILLVQCVFARNAEVWTYQFWLECHHELSVTMVQVPEGTTVSTHGLTKVAPFYAFKWLITFCKLDNSFLIWQA